MPAGIEAWLPLFLRRPPTSSITCRRQRDRGSGGSRAYASRQLARDRGAARGSPSRPRAPVAAAGGGLRARGRCPVGARRASANPAHAGQGRADQRRRRHSRTFASGPPPELRADSRAQRPLDKLERFVASFDGRILVTADSGRSARGSPRHAAPPGHRRRKSPRTGRHTSESGRALGLAIASDVRGLLLPSRSRSRSWREDQLFGERARQERRRRRVERDPEAILRELATLSPGAPVVHEEYGVGRYRGLKVMQVAGNPAEFLVIEYAGGDLLYVPVHALGLRDALHRRLARFGAVAQARHRAVGARCAARRRARAMSPRSCSTFTRARAAREGRPVAFRRKRLSRLRSRVSLRGDDRPARGDRGRARGHALGRPMDRVVCGDVGFGKTEVALRAAFAAVTGGRQVAVLVPTTLLAQQHAQTFRRPLRRLAGPRREPVALPHAVREQRASRRGPQVRAASTS